MANATAEIFIRCLPTQSGIPTTAPCQSAGGVNYRPWPYGDVLSISSTHESAVEWLIDNQASIATVVAGGGPVELSPADRAALDSWIAVQPQIVSAAEPLDAADVSAVFGFFFAGVVLCHFIGNAFGMFARAVDRF
jgi:hypothetical protein